MKKTNKVSNKAPNKVSDKAANDPASTGNPDILDELARIRKALEDIASKLTPQYPQYPQYLQWWHAPAPAAPHYWDRTPDFPVTWDGSPRIMC